MLDFDAVDKIKLIQLYKEHFPCGFDAYNAGFYPIYDFFGHGSTVTWCPFCERQAYVTAVTFDWWFHEACGCVFTKVILYE